LIDLLVVTGYVAAFSMGRFVYKLYVFGHTLDPEAPLTMRPFTPAIFGSKQIANFTTHSYPQLGTLYIGVFTAGVIALLVWHLVAGRRTYTRGLGDPAVKIA
jgi:hypothetical protein